MIIITNIRNLDSAATCDTCIFTRRYCYWKQIIIRVEQSNLCQTVVRKYKYTTSDTMHQRRWHRQWISCFFQQYSHKIKTYLHLYLIRWNQLLTWEVSGSQHGRENGALQMAQTTHSDSRMSLH